MIYIHYFAEKQNINTYLKSDEESAQSDFAFSNFLPLDLTYGLVWDPGTPGAGPKCFLDSLSLEALRRSVLVPDGAVMINSSRVMHFPPALTILALAVSVNLNAATVIFGTSRSLTSSVTEATTTAIFSYPLRSWLIFEIEIGGLLTLEETSLLKTVDENPDPVLLARNLKSLMRR